MVEDDAGWRSILEELVERGRIFVARLAPAMAISGLLRRENFALAVIDLSLKGTLSYGREPT